MICRLIQHEKIRAGQHQLQKCQPRLLAAGKVADHALHLVAAEQERAEIPPRRFLVRTELVEDFLEHRPLFVQSFMLLGEIPDLYAAA